MALTQEVSDLTFGFRAILALPELHRDHPDRPRLPEDRHADGIVVAEQDIGDGGATFLTGAARCRPGSRLGLGLLRLVHRLAELHRALRQLVGLVLDRLDVLALQRLLERFERAFWCEELSTYALALDGGKRPCRVRTSNAGHCLFGGIASREHAARTAETLLARDSFSGWGIRTLSSREIRYNPMSYHNGSVWPHDNALIASGMGRYDLKSHAATVLTGLFDSSIFVDLHRLPELFCGFTRRPGRGPTLYPVACAPQSWSAATVFALLQACLGMRISGPEARISFHYPLLPKFLREVQIHNIRVGPAAVDLLLLRHGHDVGINVLRREGNVELLMVK